MLNYLSLIGVYSTFNVVLVIAKPGSVFLFFFFFFMAYGNSQARGLIGAAAAGYATATALPDRSPTCDLHHSSRQCQILNPLNKARD